MDRLKQNIIANFLGKVCSVLVIFLFVPFYVNILGVENYGVVGFYAVLQGVFAFANFGLNATLSREMARLSVKSGAAQEMRDLLHTLELLFWGIASVIGMIVVVSAPMIAHKWVNAQNIDADMLENVIRLMGIAMAFLFPSNLYQGGLLGLQHQVMSNAILASTGFARGLGAVLILWLVSPTIFAFFLWQVMVNITEAVIGRFYLWNCLPTCSVRAQFNLSIFRSIWRYAAGMTGISINAVLLTQVDKIAVSKLLSLETFGYYTLASVLSQAPVVIGAPISTAVFPRLTQLVQLGDNVNVSSFYHRACQLVSVVVLPAGLILAMFSHEIIKIWTQNSLIADESAPLATFLVIGSILLSLQVVPCYLAFANGSTRLNIFYGIGMVVFLVPLMIILIKIYGATGAAVSWMLLNGSMIPVYIYFLHRRFLPGNSWRWYISDVGLPFVAAFIPLSIGRWLIPESLSTFWFITYILILWLVATAMTAMTAPEIRVFLVKTIRLRYQSRCATS